MPVNTAPGSTISRLPPPLKATAVPLLPVIVPALVSVLLATAKETPAPNPNAVEVLEIVPKFTIVPALL